MNQDKPNRGRGRPSANRRNFGDDEVQREAREEKRLIASKKRDKKEAPVHSDPTKKEEKHGLIESGKAWISKYFRGMTKTTRGNIEVKLRHDIDLQLYSLYERRLNAWIVSIKTHELTKLACIDMLRPLINVMIGVKLLHANTSNSKAEMIEFRGIERIEIDVPKRLAAVVNNLGKSDANYDNVIRIKSQNLYAKAAFFKAIVDYYGRDVNLWNRNIVGGTGLSFDQLQGFRNKNMRSNAELRYYDLTLDGVRYVNQHGKEAIEWLNDYEFAIEEDGNVKFYARLPKLDPEKMNDFTAIMEWTTKAWQMTKGLNIPDEVFGKVAYAAWLGYMPLHWLKNRKKKFEAVDDRFRGTPYEGLRIGDSLDLWGLHCMDDYFTNDDLTSNLLLLIREYRETVTPIYNQIFKMSKFVPTDYGSPAQIIEGHTMKRTHLLSDDFDVIETVDEKTRVHSRIRVSENEALLGTMLKFNDRVDFTSDYDIAYEGKTSEISTDFVLSDFSVS
jgi:hypothetical protein